MGVEGACLNEQGSCQLSLRPALRQHRGKGRGNPARDRGHRRSDKLSQETRATRPSRPPDKRASARSISTGAAGPSSAT